MSTPIIPENLLQKRSINNRQILYFNNREAYLAGIYPGNADFDGVNGDRSSIVPNPPVNPPVDYRPQMEFLAKNGNNFFRQWVIFYPLFADPTKFKIGTCDERTESVTSGGEPWRKRYSPFFYNASLKKWNLSRYNEEFFQKLRLIIKTAGDYGIVVQLTVFDRCGLDFVGGDRCLRWPYSPWNAKNNIHNFIQAPGARGVNEFYERNTAGSGTTLGALQDAYVNKLVTSTLEFPNVVYEIMNEPISYYPANNAAEEQLHTSRRVKWADAIVGAIYRHTQGRRFIFYNDHTGLSDWRIRGQDVIHWARPNNGTSNFARLDGVIFHGDVKAVNPETLGWTFAKNLIVQVSTDTFGGRDKEYNQLTTVNAFTHHMMFQAEEVPVEIPEEDNAAAGIGSAVPAPTLFKLPPFVATWVKVSENPTTGFPHTVFTQNADASMVAMNPDTDRLTQQGRVIQLYAKKIAFWNATLQRVGVQEYAFADTAQTVLTLKRADGGVQTYKKYTGPLVPFLYQWERISDTAPSPVAPFFVFFYPDGTLRVRRISDFAVTTQARVTLVTTQPRQIHIHNDTANNDVVWNYSFTDGGQKLTLEKVVTDPAQAVTRVYRRVV